MKFVYFLRPVGMEGPIKIGCSARPEGRANALSTWSPFPLEIIAQIDGDFDLERRFHALFIDTHQRREWFDWSDKMREVVDAINACAFDINALPDGCGVASYIRGQKRPRTPEQCKDLSYSLRVGHLSRRSGYTPRISAWRAMQQGDALAISYFDAFLSAPHQHGKPIDADWARKARDRFGASKGLASPEAPPQ
jgi:hypothetical protein